ncbi:MAG: hypothetical protein RXN91_09580, partial [Caldivirga sp.]
MYIDRYIASWVVLGIVIGLGLGAVVGYLTPIPGLTHLKTVTIVNSTTITEVLNTTRTVTYTTTVNGKAVTMTTTYIMPTTTTRIVNNTITRIIVVPTTTTVRNTTTITSTTTIPPYTLTVTTTVIENASVLPPLNITNLNDTITWMRTDYSLSMLTLANLSLPLGYCLATMWVFPNASITIVGAWIAPVSAIQQALNNSLVAPVLAYTFPRTGVNEYQFYPPQVVWINPQSFMVSTAGFNGAWALSTAGYPWSGYTVVAMASMHPSYVDWAFRYLNNGTYL